MSRSTTEERLKEAMAIRHLKQADVVRKASLLQHAHNRTLTKNALSQYVNGKAVPKRDMIALLAEALDVSDAWLTGFDVPMERDMPAPAGGDGITSKDIGFIHWFRSLPEEKQKAILISQDAPKELL